MKVKELIEKLKKEDQNAIVVALDYDGSTHVLRHIQQVDSRQNNMDGHLSESLRKKRNVQGASFVWLKTWKS